MTLSRAIAPVRDRVLLKQCAGPHEMPSCGIPRRGGSGAGRLGPVTGLVHGAGVIHDKRIAEKTSAQFDSVFDTKVLGLEALLDATANEPLRFLCFFSSVAARGGNIGQSDYAMANEALNKEIPNQPRISISKKLQSKRS